MGAGIWPHMNLRQLMILVVALAALVWGGVRIAKMFGGEKRENFGLPPDQMRTWKCREKGCITNLTPAEVDAQFAAGKITLDPADLAIQLYECPVCRKQTLEQTVIQIQPEATR